MLLRPSVAGPFLSPHRSALAGRPDSLRVSRGYLGPTERADPSRRHRKDLVMVDGRVPGEIVDSLL